MAEKKLRPLTLKQEAFAQAYILSQNGSEAFRAVYNCKGKANTVYRQVYAILENPKVRARIAELRRPLNDLTKYGLTEALADARDAFNVSKGKGNGGAMTAAATLMAKLHGLLVDRREVRTGPLDGLSASELTEINQVIAQAQASRVEH